MIARAAAAAALVLACCRSAPDAGSGPPPERASSAPSVTVGELARADEAGSEADASTPRAPPPKAGHLVGVSAQTFEIGSTPGDPGRDPTVEPLLAPHALGAFFIDALPYPNDPAEPPKTNVTRAEAERLCADRGARLCDELEWEAACRGVPEVRAMGTLREMTSGALLRGARPADKRAGSRGCARRSRAPEVRAADLGFRCCKGPPQTASMPAIDAKPTFRKTALRESDIARIVLSIPELGVLAEPRLFGGDSAPYLARATAPHEGVVFTTAPLLFSPEPGAELLVFTGRSGSMAFVVAVYPLAGGGHRLASYLLLEHEPNPVALAYRPGEKKLHWTTCWMCPAEQGSVSVDREHRIIIAQD